MSCWATVKLKMSLGPTTRIFGERPAECTSQVIRTVGAHTLEERAKSFFSYHIADNLQSSVSAASAGLNPRLYYVQLDMD